jgi:ATP-dependent exoDNAse (exonuclease V) beta subunit
VKSADQSRRDRFIHELGTNFSVVAAAGSGKTRAITDRIVEMARRADALALLPSLIVVTYTNRAADEMQQRARQALLDARLPLDVLAAFGRAFFGTIHSFCGRLLRSHGHWLGLPANLENVAADDSGIWREFVQTLIDAAPGLAPEARLKLLRLVPASALLELARICPPGTEAPEPGPFPALDLSGVHAFSMKGSGAENAARSKERLCAWVEQWEAGAGFAPFPAMAGNSEKLKAIWNAAKEPLDRWVRAACLRCGTALAREFRAHRVSRGLATFDDQVSLARELCRHPDAGPVLRALGFRIVLDEAQDTDPGQFDVLIELARPASAAGAWLEEGAFPPRPGHFSMVGDFQQSIYHQRADLGRYRRIHEALSASPGGAALEFSVTFRLDGAPIDFVNSAFAHVLTGRDGQVHFIPLEPRPGVLPGQVLRIETPEPPQGSAAGPESFAAAHLAGWLKNQGLAALRAAAWSDVAILCPRKAWFRAIRAALHAAGFAVEVHSADEVQGESPAYAWVAALMTIFAEPRNAFEIAGVLREIYAISDHDLAEFTGGYGDRLQIAAPSWQTGSAAEALRELQQIAAAIEGRALFDQLETILRDTQLRLRLRCLPGAAAEGFHEEIERLVARAAAEEARGATLSDFARDLRRAMIESRPLRPHRADAIQLLTCHKAKGCEWQVVILPFLARKVRPRAPSYPMFLRSDGDGLPAAIPTALHKLDLPTYDVFEAGRLLYVAATRARHTLVLMDDSAACWGRKDGKSSLDLLGAAEAGPNADLLERLPAVASRCAATEAQHADADAARSAREMPPLPQWLPSDWSAARHRSAGIRNRTPSGMAEAADDRFQTNPPLPALPGAGALFGAWWHSFIERIDWLASHAEWERHFAAAKLFSPEPSRAEREWRTLRRVLDADPAQRWMLRPGLIHHAEMPFLWPICGTDCLEGIVDLAVFDPEAGAWLILDWKTNAITTSQLGEMLDHYAPQLAAYRAAFRDMLGGSVRAAVYSTALGQWHTYPEEMLDAVWQNISRDLGEIARAVAREEGFASEPSAR